MCYYYTLTMCEEATPDSIIVELAAILPMLSAFFVKFQVYMKD